MRARVTQKKPECSKPGDRGALTGEAGRTRAGGALVPLVASGEDCDGISPVCPAGSAGMSAVAGALVWTWVEASGSAVFASPDETSDLLPAVGCPSLAGREAGV
jgi:hypothetical protein